MINDCFTYVLPPLGQIENIYFTNYWCGYPGLWTSCISMIRDIFIYFSLLGFILPYTI